VRNKTGGAPVDARTVFQIGSTTKGFLAATLAIMVDRGKLRWDDRVVDLDADFQLRDPWATREFRIFDLLAQRSGLPAHANDALGMLGLDEPALIRSLSTFETAAKLFAKPASPRPFPPLAALAGNFANASFGKAKVALDNGALVMDFEATGAGLKLEPWDGDVFTATLVPRGRFVTVAENIGAQPSAFVQFQIDKEGKLDVLRLSFDDGQAYNFRRE
jgi:hypothetical protein